MTGERFLSPNEAAKRLGVSIRALRLYERRGLVTPRRTSAGWRAYGQAEIGRLHQVLALKSLGLPLGRIAELLSGRQVDLAAMLSLQEAALQQRQAELGHAIASIRAARARLAAQETLSLDDITNLAREAAMTIQYSDEAWDALFEPFFRRRLSDAQYDALMGRKPESLKALGLTEAGYDEAWRSMIADATQLMERGDDSSPEAADVLRRWMELTDVFTKGDAELQSGSMLAIYDGLADPAVAAHSAISEDLITFMHLVGMKKALREAPFDPETPAATGDHSASEAAVRRLVAQLARGEATDLGGADPAEGKGPPPALMKALFALLGPLRSARYLWTDAEGDVHRVAFANGALKCVVRRDAEGRVTYATLVTGDKPPA